MAKSTKRPKGLTQTRKAPARLSPLPACHRAMGKRSAEKSVTSAASQTTPKARRPWQL